MREPFGARLVAAVARTAPLCAGIDPSSTLLHEWGLADDARGLASFGARCVEAFAGVVPVVKPQVAFFERHGSAGIAVLEGLIAEARDAGLLVIADAKRGDVDSTCAAYAEAWLSDTSPLVADAVTVHPYLGLGALAPITDAALATGRGVFVVVRSSNQEGRSLQEAQTAAGPAVEDALLTDIAAMNEQELARASALPLGSVGAVVGATMRPSAFDLPTMRGPLLAPGLGAQGAGPADVAKLFAGCTPGSVLPSASRSLLSKGPDAGAMRVAAAALCDELAAAWA
jgi:orotidine-5'-phosphate decarboxylase